MEGDRREGSERGGVLPEPGDGFIPGPARIPEPPRVRYTFPDAEPPGPPPPLPSEPARRAKPPIRLAAGPRRTLAALARAVAPEKDLGFDVPEQVTRFVEGFAPYLPRPLPALLPFGLRAWEWLPLVVGPRRGRLSRLPKEAARAHLERLERSPGRELVRSFLGLLSAGIYDHEAAHDHLRYHPQPFLDEKVQERKDRFGIKEPW